jgi:hypothetical protein
MDKMGGISMDDMPSIERVMNLDTAVKVGAIKLAVPHKSVYMELLVEECKRADMELDMDKAFEFGMRGAQNDIKFHSHYPSDPS